MRSLFVCILVFVGTHQLVCLDEIGQCVSLIEQVAEGKMRVSIHADFKVKLRHNLIKVICFDIIYKQLIEYHIYRFALGNTDLGHNIP